MEPKYTFTYKWTQPYNIDPYNMEMIKELVIEQLLEDQVFTEANQVINRIKAL